MLMTALEMWLRKNKKTQTEDQTTLRHFFTQSFHVGTETFSSWCLLGYLLQSLQFCIMHLTSPFIPVSQMGMRCEALTVTIGQQWGDVQESGSVRKGL